MDNEYCNSVALASGIKQLSEQLNSLLLAVHCWLSAIYSKVSIGTLLRSHSSTDLSSMILFYRCGIFVRIFVLLLMKPAERPQFSLPPSSVGAQRGKSERPDSWNTFPVFLANGRGRATEKHLDSQ